MFRKIVSNLSFSPALVGQLGFYAKRLRKEEMTRRVGLVFVALALVVQCLVVFQPPESANASSDNDFIPGGLGLGSSKSINNFLGPYDANSRHLRDVVTSIGITRDEIANAQFNWFITGEKYGWGYDAYRAYATPFSARDSAGNVVQVVGAKKMNILNGSNAQIYGWIGHSAKVGWFAVMQACGNIVTDIIPPEPTPPAPPTPTPTPVPTPTPEPTPPPTVAPGNVVFSKTAKNITQGNVEASSVAAQQNDRITYTLTAKNTGGSTIPTIIEDDIGDVLQYAKLVDNGGGSYNESNHRLSWAITTIVPSGEQSRIFTVQVLDKTPDAPVGQSDPTSFDCRMENKFGNSISIKVSCAPPKVVEQVVTQLPHTGPTENMIFAGVVLAVVVYFYARSRQVGKEIRLIRRDLNAGAL